MLQMLTKPPNILITPNSLRFNITFRDEVYSNNSNQDADSPIRGDTDERGGPGFSNRAAQPRYYNRLRAVEGQTRYGKILAAHCHSH